MFASETEYQFGNHLRTRGTVQALPDDSVINALTGSTAADLWVNLRMMFSAKRSGWDVRAAGEGIFLYGDTVEYTRELVQQAPGFEELFGRLPNDDRRWWNLTNTIDDDGKRAVIARFDRLSVGYTGANASMRFGRQAITWGNGLFFTPMDIVNPFDPTQIDTEYKPGDDMLYGQLLRGNGDDGQGTYVVRRDPVTGDVDSEQATLAGKYHGFLGMTEYDLLAAWHYDEPLYGLGIARDVGGAVWRGDVVLSDTKDQGIVTQFVVNASYSWVWAGKNMSGSAEYYFNGFGQSDGCYSPTCLSANPDLVQRIARRQLFTLGKNYVAGNLTVEVTPLFSLIPNLFWNVGDGSALLQVVTQNSLGDNLVLLGAIGLPIGPSGTEYGGIETDVPGTYFSTSLSLFLQLGWYF